MINFNKKLFGIASIIVVFLAFFSGMVGAYMLDPFVNTINRLGLFQILASNTQIFDFILISILLIMLFRKILKSRFGEAIGGVFGLIFAMAFGVFEYKTGFSLIQALGPWSIGIALLILTLGIFVLLHKIFDGDKSFVFAIVYSFMFPFFLSVPAFANFGSRDDLFGALYAILLILWLVALGMLLIKGYQKIAGTVTGHGGHHGH